LENPLRLSVWGGYSPSEFLFVVVQSCRAMRAPPGLLITGRCGLGGLQDSLQLGKIGWGQRIAPDGRPESVGVLC
jgi:hypothetical protein